MSEQQSKFEGWAVVELFGHQKIAGFVTTEYYGQAAMFRVDVPEIPAREIVVDYPRYDAGGRLMPSGSKAEMEARPGYSRLVGPGAVYAINPSAEEAVRKLLAQGERPLKLIELPEGRTLPAGEVTREPYEGDVEADLWEGEDDIGGADDSEEDLADAAS